MNWFSFKSKFHPSWHAKMRPFIESAACDEIFKSLKARGAGGAKIGPTSHNTFKAFMIPMNTIKAVILGGNPYDGFIDGKPVASGRLLDCAIIGQVSYELANFYRGLEVEMFNGLSLVYDQKHYSTQYLEDQGVMMLNSALTVEEFGDHGALWMKFADYIMENIIVDLDVPVIFLGKQAQNYMDCMGDSFLAFPLDEPAGTIKDWDTKGTFQKVDELIEENNQDSIMWLSIDCPF